MKRIPKKTMKWGRKILSRCLYFCLFLMALSLVYNSSSEVEPEDVFQVIEREPIQTKTNRELFEIEKLGRKYFVEPIFDYELWGVVVSKNHMNSIFDRHNIKHEVRVQDLCVIWGDNARNNITRFVGVRSENYTCFFYPKKQTANWSEVQFDQIANNHLLATDPDVIRTIKNVEIGDQIHFKGVLANYGRAGTDQYIRQSSVVRTDGGDGACETVFVDEVNIIKRKSPVTAWLMHNAKYLFLFFLFLRIVIEFFKEPSRKPKEGTPKKTGFEIFEGVPNTENPPKKSPEKTEQKPQEMPMFARGIKSGLLPDYSDKKDEK